MGQHTWATAMKSKGALASLDSLMARKLGQIGHKT